MLLYYQTIDLSYFRGLPLFLQLAWETAADRIIDFDLICKTCCLFINLFEFFPIFSDYNYLELSIQINLILNQYQGMHKVHDKFKIKKKIKINSLEAAICNVALFKSMKDKDFKDTIFISYCEQGVILQAINEFEWKKAHEYIENFLYNKKIQLLIDGFDKDVYEGLINKGLKQITRKIREAEQQCPYINIIHYQKLRKSCEYMDKQKYVQPLKDWEKKTKKNPNFAFLIVEPKQKFDEVKRNLLQYLHNESIYLRYITLDPIEFMYLLFYSPIKQSVRNQYNRKQIEICIEKQEHTQFIKVINFTNLNISEYGYNIVKGESNITKSGVGFQVISANELKNEIKNSKIYCKQSPVELIEQYVADIEESVGENFFIVPYKQQQEQKYRALIEKYTNSKYSKQQIEKKLEMCRIFELEEIELINELYSTKKYTAWKAFVNGCPFMLHEYQAADIDMETFIIYLDQLQAYYCSSLIRYYGIIIKRARPQQIPISHEPISYLLVFDYHTNSLKEMADNGLIVDNMQIATFVLQTLYLINFLHSQQQPRCLGPIESREIFWPMAMVLPYLGISDDQPIYSIQNDVKQVGLLGKQLLGEEDDEDLSEIMTQMTSLSKYERPSIKKCIAQFQQLLCL